MSTRASFDPPTVVAELDRLHEVGKPGTQL